MKKSNNFTLFNKFVITFIFENALCFSFHNFIPLFIYHDMKGYHTVLFKYKKADNFCS